VFDADLIIRYKSMSQPPKKSYNQKVDFSDTEIYEEIKDEIR
jgi:hypothetical protein